MKEKKNLNKINKLIYFQLACVHLHPATQLYLKSARTERIWYDCCNKFNVCLSIYFTLSLTHSLAVDMCAQIKQIYMLIIWNGQHEQDKTFVPTNLCNYSNKTAE